jgi:hypothetical protein
MVVQEDLEQMSRRTMSQQQMGEELETVPCCQFTSESDVRILLFLKNAQRHPLLGQPQQLRGMVATIQQHLTRTTTTWLLARRLMLLQLISSNSPHSLYGRPKGRTNIQARDLKEQN